MASVTAVIPTIGRPELRRAVESVLAQTVPVHPLVVLDRPSEIRQVSEALDGLPHELIVTPGSVMGGAARNIGIHAVQTPVVAFLDDDDEWFPFKTELQLPKLELDSRMVVASRVHLVGKVPRVLPEYPFDGSTTIGTYLLRRTTLRLRKNFMQSSTLLMSTHLARETPWSENLGRHQDWDLLIRLENSGAKIETIEQPLVMVYQSSVQSVSKSRDWQTSYSWLQTVARDVDRRSQGDFLASIVLRGAVASRAHRNALGLAMKAMSLGCHPTAMLAGLIGAFRG